MDVKWITDDISRFGRHSTNGQMTARGCITSYCLCPRKSVRVGFQGILRILLLPTHIYFVLLYSVDRATTICVSAPKTKCYFLSAKLI